MDTDACVDWELTEPKKKAKPNKMDLKHSEYIPRKKRVVAANLKNLIVEAGRDIPLNIPTIIASYRFSIGTQLWGKVEEYSGRILTSNSSCCGRI